MPAYPDSKFSLELVQNYFAQLNPIANRIASDINETKANYGQLWCTLSPIEQNDIINETLIRPELSLRYFDSFSTTSTESSSPSQGSICVAPSSKSASADSLTAVVLKNINNTLGKTRNETETKPKPCVKSPTNKESKKTLHGHNVKHYYGYDGRNLRTFALQKVALKIVHDDALGAYRDEHSLPFSFRTRSQINLRLFIDATNENASKVAYKDDEICLLNAAIRARVPTVKEDVPKHDKTSIENYKKLQDELKFNLRRDSREKLIVGNSAKTTPIQTFERLDNQKSLPQVPPPIKAQKSQAPRPQVKPPPAPKNSNNGNNNVSNIVEKKQSIIVDCKNLDNAVSNRNPSEERVKAYLSANTPTSTSMSYAVYSDAYYDHGEHTNLMQNYGSSGGFGSGILTASSSSAATSDDDDEKTLCEEVKLLDNDASLRKGFDFLNNW